MICRLKALTDELVSAEESCSWLLLLVVRCCKPGHIFYPVFKTQVSSLAHPSMTIYNAVIAELNLTYVQNT